MVLAGVGAGAASILDGDGEVLFVPILCKGRRGHEKAQAVGGGRATGHRSGGGGGVRGGGRGGGIHAGGEGREEVETRRGLGWTEEQGLGEAEAAGEAEEADGEARHSGEHHGRQEDHGQVALHAHPVFLPPRVWTAVTRQIRRIH